MARKHLQAVDVDPKADLSPDSMLWRYGADRRILLFAPANGLMLNMLPGVSAAIMEQSVFWDEPIQRTLRSVPQIVNTIYDQECAHRVRDYHRDLKGVDHHGERFHALSPELYFASHAIFTYIVMTFVDTFVEPLDDAQRAALYDECRTWYLRYGVSARAMPESWAEFETYWAELCCDGLQVTPSAQRLLEHVLVSPAVTPPPYVPRSVWRVLRPIAGDNLRVLTTGPLPEPVRQTLGLPWSTTDRLRYAALVGMLRVVWPVLPGPIREITVARGSKRRALGHVA
jgi:uncharacterized protein (DUF2236 family)